MEVWVFLLVIVGLVLALLYWRSDSSSFETLTSQEAVLPVSERAPNDGDSDDELLELKKEAQRILDEGSTDPVIVASQDLMGFVDQHIETLSAKKRQMSFVDDYGKENTSRFEAELDHFVRNVVPFDLVRSYAGSAGIVVGEPIDLAKGLVREQLKWHNRKKSRELHQANEAEQAPETKAIQYEPDMNGVEFEKLVKSKLEEQGYFVTDTPASGDQGVDLLLSSNEKSIAVQCKRSASSIGNSAVQQVVAGKVHYAADEAWVVSDADFTAAARRLASTNEVKLVNFFTL